MFTQKETGNINITLNEAKIMKELYISLSSIHILRANCLTYG